MKRLIAAIIAISALPLCKVLATTTQANNLGVVNLYLKSQTQSQIVNSTATAVGQLVYCSNCTANGNAGTICISTGTTAAFQFVLSTGTPCK